MSNLVTEKLGANKTEYRRDGLRVLYSYSTPVAAYREKTNTAMRTETTYSVTTTRHINQWLNAFRCPVLEVPQDQITVFADRVRFEI